MTPALLLYRATSGLLAPLAPHFLQRRAAHDKEDPARLGERMGRAKIRRSGGPLVWLHGASIGEGLALLPLIEALTRSGAHALATTGTRSSAQVVGDRLPPGAIHQYVPLDCPSFARRFLDHWRPDVAIFAESELWPNLVLEARRRGAALFLVNARMSDKSVARWRRAPGMAATILDAFDNIFAQSADDAARFASLGATRVTLAGNLKYDVAPPPADLEALAQLTAQIGARPVWVAASTHEGEEEICLAAHSILRARFPDLLTIIAPRNARRGRDIAALARQTGAEPALRSAGEKIGSDTQVFVADTFGEMGLWYRLTSIVFVGKSLTAGGGQNPIEPAKLGAAIVYGPSVENFADAYATLDAAGGGARACDAGELAARLAALFADPAAARGMARAAAGAVERLAGTTATLMAQIAPHLATREAAR
ncbi:MAG: 3-deoxy-D-manno-octulosonic acid transferase [Methylobacteriaceae bacterium]|nr:3-deoxy-D-manno-octulosonic acid transferase [Methylobacteriaceae bacterium]